ncbi:MAG: peptidoglycan-binding domain-containing protein [Pseudonocardiaceae bacterium]
MTAVSADQAKACIRASTPTEVATMDASSVVAVSLDGSDGLSRARFRTAARLIRTVRRSGLIAVLTAASVTTGCNDELASLDPAQPPSPTTIPAPLIDDARRELSMPPDLRTDCDRLRAGSQGSCVQKLQGMLNARGAQLPGNETFGERTLDAVRQFQNARGLQVTGIVSDDTKAALYDLPPDDVDLDLRTDCIDLDQGAQGWCALSLQHLLIQYGAPLHATGTYGPQTADAVRQFQRDHQLPTTGATHSMTKKSLYDNLATLVPATPNTAVSCPGPECNVYLGRATTAGLAAAFDKGAILIGLATAVISVLVCTVLKATSPLAGILCEQIVQMTATAIIALFQQARDNHECIKVNLQPTDDGVKPVAPTRTDGAPCPA